MYKIVTFDNGLRLVYEKIPYVRSVATGIWVGTGSRREDMGNNGSSHFIEHMLFKGTKTKSAKDIAECIDNIGGQINAFTGKECTCYYTKTLDTHIDIVFELLSDMFFNSKFLKKDIDIERNVIIEEINMYEDSPEETVHDLISEITWKNDSLGYSILGTEKSLSKLDDQALKNYMNTNYNPWNTVVSIAGNFDENHAIDLVKKYFANWDKKARKKEAYSKVNFLASTEYREKDTEQVHVCIGFEGVEQGSDDLYPLLAINNVLGGGMSSILFQKVREEKGLVYSIYSYPSAYSNAGIFNIYAGMNPSCMEQVLDIVAREIKDFKKNKISKIELEKIKEQLKGNYILGLESTSSRMNSIGKSLLMLDKIHTQEEILKKIDDINITRVDEIIERIINLNRYSMAVVGQIHKKLDFKDFI